MAKKKKPQQKSRSEMRSLRIQQVVFIAIGVLVILSMVLAMVAK